MLIQRVIQGEDWGRILRGSRWFCQNTETNWRLLRLRWQTDDVNCQNIILVLCTLIILLLQAYRQSNYSLILLVCSLIKDDQSAFSVRIIILSEKIHGRITFFIYPRVLICTRSFPFLSESTDVYRKSFIYTRKYKLGGIGSLSKEKLFLKRSDPPPSPSPPDFSNFWIWSTLFP